MPLDAKFSEKRVLITGGSRGIGRAIAKQFHKLGAEVIITSTGRKPRWTSKCFRLHHIKLNFLNQDSLESFFKEVNLCGKIDILISNAGIHSFESFDAISDIVWKSIFTVNVDGPMRLIRFFGSQMMQHRGGKIVCISSIAAEKVKKNSAAYTMSKAALNGLVKAAAIDFAPYNILVNTVSPGPTQTDMLESLVSPAVKKNILKGIPMGTFASPQDISNAVIFLCSDSNTHITGQNLIVDGGRSIFN